MKARPVRKLDPSAPLADNAERIIRELRTLPDLVANSAPLPGMDGRPRTDG